MFKGIKRIINGTWELPNRDLVSKDPVLFSMILNPWYIRDDVFYTKQKIQYTFDLRTFIIDGVEFSNFKDTGGGVYHSSYENVINANSSTQVDCSEDIIDVITCRDNPGICPCSVQNVPIHYLYIDSTLLVELPAQFYLGKIPDSQTNRVKVKIYGKEKELDIKPLRIETLKDMEDLIFKRFYETENITYKQIYEDALELLSQMQIQRRAKVVADSLQTIKIKKDSIQAKRNDSLKAITTKNKNAK
jgi:hypothetical protein